ncbi:MAG: VWA domain-containing protein [Polyangiaceae bacterium]|nr:VWA domain-containing protein [Polyangiaceae bacterium]MCB9609952.1 VWA domain-containing protein [Polyangiaceae bacterium]
MKFANSEWLWGAASALLVAALLIYGGIRSTKALARFGDEEQVLGLVTSRASARRAFKGVLLVLAVALGFVALAGPQYGRGTRLIPATNLDVVLVLDFSKSMYARDVRPSRIDRAKSEIARLIAELPGARFGAVAFAGDPLSFPLTSDGGAIAQFLRQQTPNDMPVGGTAIGRALEAGRDLLRRDPLSQKHAKVMILVTDGEDLEGDPVAVATAAAREGITVHVVQIGGRTPEPIPEMSDQEDVVGWRTDSQGKPLTTELTAEGEQQLAQIAERGNGVVVRASKGETGIREITSRLSKLMTEELAEKEETVYADVFYYPAALALVLLLIEVFVAQAKRRKRPPEPPPQRPKREPKNRRRDRLRATAATGAALVLIMGCERLDKVFERNAPDVDRSIELLDAGAAAQAGDLLENYLSTGACKDGAIGTPPRVRDRPAASFDLGLALFKIAESFGGRFEVIPDGGVQPMDDKAAARNAQIECAQRIVRLIAADPAVALELRARAYYLAGNLEFLRGNFEEAIKSYDEALKITPGLPDDKGDPIGRDAAWNRAIALELKEQQEPPDAGSDANDDASDGSDGSQDAQPDSGDDGGNDGGDGGDEGGKDGGGDDAGDDAGKQDNKPDGGKDGGASDAGKPPQPQQPPSVNQDDRMLDMLERAPTLQQEAAKRNALQQRVRGLEDK